MALLSRVTRIRHNYWLLTFPQRCQLLTTKMSEHAPPAVPTLTKATLGNITITKEKVLQQLKQVDTKKALGLDNISPHMLKRCATQLATIFQRCLSSQQ